MGTASTYGLENHHLTDLASTTWNASAPQLYEVALKNNEGKESADGAFVVTTGIHTGRSTNDRFIVKNSTSENTIHWGETNVSMSQEHFDALYQDIQNHYKDKNIFIQDCYTGADKKHRKAVRIITETAWHNLFARNMFLQPKPGELSNFKPEITVIHAPSMRAKKAKHGTNSNVAIAIDLQQNLVLIAGTSYAGEIKKSVFSIMNYMMPAEGVLPMHSSANTDKNGNTAIFFGLSGTGKTTLSADTNRTLIGDDEHGWSDDSVFNFEGGCYAKVIRLSEKDEPEIYNTTKRFGTVLENVVMDKNGKLDLDDATLTENTRASYPIASIPNVSKNGIGKKPTTIIMLTADAFGVLPPISKLTADQAMYHFLSGYTAKVAGTEKGLGKEPVACFSACFGLPFMPRNPKVYAELLKDKINNNNVECWLVNTGWTGGAYGTGERMSIKHTRAMINAALSGELAKVKTTEDEFFGLHIPISCHDVPSEVLNPQSTWNDKKLYAETANKVLGMFEENFKQFESMDGKLCTAA